MRRREFITLVGSAAATWPIAARAQQPSQIRRIGVLMSGLEADAQGGVQALLQGLQDLGWKPGTNLQVDIRYGDGNRERIAAVAKELVAAQPEVLQVTSTPGTAAVLKETRTIPVVFAAVADPVEAGFVQSLPHPGGNATGFINIESSLHGGQMAPAPQGGDAAGAAGDGAVQSHNRAPDGLLSASERGGCAVFGNHDKDGSGQQYGRDGKGNRDYRPG